MLDQFPDIFIFLRISLLHNTQKKTILFFEIIDLTWLICTIILVLTQGYGTNKIDAQNFINPGNRFSTCAQIIGLKKKLGGLEGKILHHEITEM